MHEQEKPRLNSQDVTTLAAVSPQLGRGLAVAGIVVLALAGVLGWWRGDDWRYFCHAYLVNYVFYLSLSLGALFFVTLHHASRAGWSVCVRRVLEIVSANVLLMAVLFVPVLLAALFGGSSLYEWTDAAVVKGDHVLEGKGWYLNLPFFILRALIFFGVWGGLSWFFWRGSLKQDENGDVQLSLRMEWISYPALILFAVTVTLASFDWLMSLTPHWFSTIYGVYYFAGAVVSSLATVILVLMLLQANGRLTTTVTTEHYHELGKLLFGFIVFWGYIAFSQYMLIWYANIPEETDWYQPRQTGGWIVVSLILVFGHLLIPFFGLISRSAKRSKPILGFWAVWLLITHWIDMHYLVMPHVGTPGFPLGVIDFVCLAGMGLLFAAGIIHFAGDRQLVPAKDPRIAESLGFENL